MENAIFYKGVKYGGGSSSDITPNPQDTPTDTLETIEIDGTVYEIAGGGDDYIQKRLVYILTAAGAWEYFTNPQSDNPLLVEVVGGGAIRSYRVDTDLLPTYESYTTIGTDIGGRPLNMTKVSNGDLGISIDYNGDISYETVKVYEVVSYNSEGINNAELLWTGDQSGDGSIVVDGLSDWLVVGYCNYTGSDAHTYMSIGTPARGGENYGEYGSGNIVSIGHRFGFNSSTNTLTINNENRGIYFNGGTTHDQSNGCHIYAIYGLVRVEGSSSGKTTEVELIPQMTSATAPSGLVSRSSVAASQHEAWYAFDGVPGSTTTLTNTWLAASDDYTPWIRYDFTTGRRLDRISIQVVNNNTAITRDLTIEGKVGNTWENCLKSGNSVEVTFYQDELTTYSFNLNGNEYSAIKITGDDRFYTGSGGSAAGFSEIQVFSLVPENVIEPNPEGTPTDTLDSLRIGSDIYGIDTGTEVVANPVGTATGTLETVQIDSTIYELAGGTEVDELTLSEYNLLPTATKNDGTIRFIPADATSESEAIDMEHATSFVEPGGCMAFEATSNTLTTVSYLGGVYIGLAYYYTTKVDVTDWDKLIMDIHTGSCYGGGSQSTQQSFNLYIGLFENAIQARFDPISAQWVTSINYNLSNHDYSNTEIDVSELTGEYYLTVSAPGWNATIENIRLATLGGYPSQIKYMGETYGIANIKELTEGNYQALTNVEKNNGTVYFTHDGDEEVDLTVRMTGSTSTSGTASAFGSLNENFLAWHAFASEDDFDANVNGEYWAGNGEGAYLQFDFTNAVSITKVAYASYLYSSFDLMYSTDGTTYHLAETLTQADQGTTTPTKQDYILSNSIANVISIRFVCNGVYNIGALHIYGNDGSLTPNHIYLNDRCYTSYKPRVSFLYWAGDFASTIVFDEDIRNFDRIMIFTSGGKPFTCDSRDYFNGNQEYFGVGIASNKYVWYSVGSDGKTLTSAYHDGLTITMVLGLNDIDTDCPWGSSHDH